MPTGYQEIRTALEDIKSDIQQGRERDSENYKETHSRLDVIDQGVRTNANMILDLDTVALQQDGKK